MVLQVKMIKQPMGTWPKQKDLKQAGGLYVMMSETGYHAYDLSLFTRAPGAWRERRGRGCLVRCGPCGPFDKEIWRPYLQPVVS